MEIPVGLQQKDRVSLCLPLEVDQRIAWLDIEVRTEGLPALRMYSHCPWNTGRSSAQCFSQYDSRFPWG